MPLTSEREPRAALLSLLADRAAGIALRYFQDASLGVVQKSDDSPVTVADREIESMLRDEILARFPSDGLVGEEHGLREGASGWNWLLDPIDGTVSFASGVPLFGTLIGLEHGGRIRAGICAMHALHERVWASEGGGAWWERRNAAGAVVRSQARVRECDSLGRALVCTSGLEYFERAGRTDVLVAVGRAAGRVRGWSDCYGGMLVATGRADGWFDPVMHPWDSGPFPILISEAGGVFTDFDGRGGAHGGSALAACPALHAELLATVRKAR